LNAAKIFKEFCLKCKSSTNHEVLYEKPINEIDKDEDGQPIHEATTKYQTIQCLGCEEVSFRSEYSSCWRSPFLVTRGRGRSVYLNLHGRPYLHE
jgi:hypothetical protein